MPSAWCNVGMLVRRDIENIWLVISVVVMFRSEMLILHTCSQNN